MADAKFELVPETWIAKETLRQPEVAEKFRRVSYSARAAAQKFDEDSSDGSREVLLMTPALEREASLLAPPPASSWRDWVPCCWKR